MTWAQHARILNIERVTVLILAQHGGKITQVNPIGQQHQHGGALNRQELELKLATVQHVHLPNVEQGGEFFLAQARFRGDIHAELLALF